MKKNNIKNFVIAIVTVLVVGLIITGSTFAYFQWTTADDQKTDVSVRIEHGQIVMTILPEDTVVSGLKPTNVKLNGCGRTAYADALVKVENGTGTIAIPSFKLKVKVDKNGTEPLTRTALEHIHYSVVPISTTVDASGNPVKGNVVGNCIGTDVDDFTDILFNNIEYGSTSGTNFKFDSVALDGSWTHIPNVGDDVYDNGGLDFFTYTTLLDEYLPRQYYISDEDPFHSKGDTMGITFKSYPGGTTYQYFRVYVWIDEEYSPIAVGNVVSDPLQNATIYVTWSEESTIQQVDGVFTPGDNYVAGSGAGTTLAAGLYDSSGNLTSWDDLITDYITVDGTVITDSDSDLTGKLVIPNGITEIGSSAFSYTHLTEIELPSTLTKIGSSAFSGNETLTSINIPASVTSIGDSAFLESTRLEEVSFAPNSKCVEIGSEAFQYTMITNIDIPLGVTSLEEGVFGYTQIKDVVIHNKITSIGYFAFSFLESITYTGTKDEWEEISKDSRWLPYQEYQESPLVIKCSDGDITLTF